MSANIIPQSAVGREPTFKGLRLADRTIEALEMMAREGVSIREAAERVGARQDNLQRAFDLPPVRQRFNQLVAYIRANEMQAAWLRMSQLARTADSEHVKMECNKWLAGVDGLAPIKRVESKYSVHHSFGGFEMGTFEDEAPED